MKFEIDYIEKLAKIIADNELTEISLEDGEQAITIRKDLAEVVTTAGAAAGATAVVTTSAKSFLIVIACSPSSNEISVNSLSAMILASFSI